MGLKGHFPRSYVIAICVVWAQASVGFIRLGNILYSVSIPTLYYAQHCFAHIQVRVLPLRSSSHSWWWNVQSWWSLRLQDRFGLSHMIQHNEKSLKPIGATKHDSGTKHTSKQADKQIANMKWTETKRQTSKPILCIFHFNFSVKCKNSAIKLTFT